ncbi:unnamed protein product [Vicia faba]|uniref:Pectinesterase inhibitor domain-containing protein n=1 Tax=Vicia faba TaxID=3906 RepID=A0AAV1AKZ7_VICFA|nr:unnamed protein product [Vicia faba]
MLKPLALLILFLSTIQPNNGENSLEKTCNQTPNKTLCIQYLESSPRSPNADVHEFALIMFNIMRDKATTTIIKIDKLLAGNNIRPGTREYKSLEICATIYKEIATSNARRALETLPAGDPEAAIDAANDVVRKANQCEDNFVGRISKDMRTPVSDDNKDMENVATISAAIAELLRRSS